MTERTLLHALEQVRRECIYGADGLEHVEALLKLRGVDPDHLYVPRKMSPDRFKNRVLKRHVVSALNEGPKTSRQIGESVHCAYPHVSVEGCVLRTRRSLYRLKLQGVVGREGILWRLMPRAANTP